MLPDDDAQSPAWQQQWGLARWPQREREHWPAFHAHSAAAAADGSEPPETELLFE